MPNPVAEGTNAQLLVSAANKLDGKILVIDLAGKICMQMNVDISASEQTIDIPTAQLSPGAYILQLQSDKGILTKRLVVTQ